MSDNNSHPGVRSLLAKFENSQSPITSPPSRGRSPVGSDTSSSARQLSKVRASFVTVEGALQSSPGSPLRKTSGPSGRSDSPGFFGPTINTKEIESRRQTNVISPTPVSSDKSPTSVLSGGESEGAETRNAIGTNEKVVPNGPVTQVPAGNAASAQSEPTQRDQPPPARMPSSNGEKKDVTKPAHKRSTSVQDRQNSTQMTTTAASQKMSGSQGGAKPQSARELAKERANALAHRPSRPSLNNASKATTRPTRGATPSADPQRATAGSSITNEARSPARSARLTSSATAHKQSLHNAKGGGAGTAPGRTEKTASSLNRKPSTLKSAASPAAAVRRQASRPSLPAQHATERPSSRVSNVGTKPVNEGFLARMMRPTASSASKTQDKSEVKAPLPKSTAAFKAPRPSAARPADRTTQQSKAKVPAAKPHQEKAQVPRKDRSTERGQPKPTEKQLGGESTIQDAAVPTPEEDSATQPQEPVPDKAADSSIEDAAKDAHLEPSPEPIEQSETGVADEVPEVVESTTDATTGASPDSHEAETTVETESKNQDMVSVADGETEPSQPLAQAQSNEGIDLETIVEPTESLVAEDATMVATHEPLITDNGSQKPEQTMTPDLLPNNKGVDYTMDLGSSQPSNPIEESKESILVEEPGKQGKSDADDIDFATLALS